jgi:ribosomal-protein-alanine N-acetyltransferase
MIDSPASPALASTSIKAGDHHHLDEVVSIMDAAFDDRFGEAWTRSQCAGILPMRGVTLLIARNGAGEAVGFSLQRIVAGDGELLLLAVDPKHRRRGVGRALLQQFIEQARHEGTSRVHLEVRDGNPAVVMYRKAGFKAVGRRRKYYHGRTGGEFDALTLSYDL